MLRVPYKSLCISSFFVFIGLLSTSSAYEYISYRRTRTVRCIYIFPSCVFLYLFASSRRRKYWRKTQAYAALPNKSINWWVQQLFCRCPCSVFLWFDIWVHPCSSYENEERDESSRRRCSFFVVVLLLNRNFFLCYLLCIFIYYTGMGLVVRSERGSSIRFLSEACIEENDNCNTGRNQLWRNMERNQRDVD